MCVTISGQTQFDETQMPYSEKKEKKKKKERKKKVTTIKESASVYSGKGTEDSAMSDAVSKRLKKSQKVISDATF